MKIPITQSKAWQDLQKDLGEESILRETDSYQYLAIIKNTPIGKYIYCPYGPVAKDRSSFKQAIKSLRLLAEKHQAFFIRIEPYEEELKKAIPTSAKKSHDLNPKETWHLDLTGKDDEFKSRLPSRLLRYHRNASKNGLEIIKSHDPLDIDYLYNLQKALADEKGISTFSKEYLKTELKQPFSTLYLAKYHNPDTNKTEVVNAVLVFDDKDTRYCLQGAQSDQGRKLHAHGIVTIQLILDARDNKQKIFDFWGIAPEGAPQDHPWAGFTNFKKTFSGYQFNHAGTYDIVENSTKYRLYQAIRRVNRLIRKSITKPSTNK